MQKYWTFALVMVVMSLLCSCGGMLGDGRMEAWRDVRVAEEETDQSFLETEQVRMTVEESSKKQQNPTLKVTTMDSAGNPVVVEMDLEPTVARITNSGKKHDTYGLDMSKTDMPEGEFAEGMKATGKAATEIASSPAVLVGTSGYFAREMLEATGGGGTEINADTANVSDSFNRNEVHATGDSNSSSLVLPGATEVIPADGTAGE